MPSATRSTSLVLGVVNDHVNKQPSGVNLREIEKVLEIRLATGCYSNSFVCQEDDEIVSTRIGLLTRTIFPLTRLRERFEGSRLLERYASDYWSRGKDKLSRQVFGS